MRRHGVNLVVEVVEIVPFTGHSCYFRCALNGLRGFPRGAPEVATESFRGGAGEILRQASVALDGRPVTLWEVTDGPTMIPRGTSDPNPRHHFTSIDVDDTLKRWRVPIRSGSRYVGCRLSHDGPWIIAPVRMRPASGPADGKERRSSTRLTLELAGLCLGLSDRRETADVGRPPQSPSIHSGTCSPCLQ
jgi:hypothetical protein